MLIIMTILICFQDNMAKAFFFIFTLLFKPFPIDAVRMSGITPVSLVKNTNVWDLILYLFHMCCIVYVIYITYIICHVSVLSNRYLNYGNPSIWGIAKTQIIDLDR